MSGTDQREVPKWIAENRGTRKDIERGADYFRVGPADIVDDLDGQAIHIHGPNRETWAKHIVHCVNTYPQLQSDLAAKDKLIGELVEVLEYISGHITFEINPSSYDHQQVCEMNNIMMQIGSWSDAALTAAKKEGER